MGHTAIRFTNEEVFGNPEFVVWKIKKCLDYKEDFFANFDNDK
jgi:very-short-patch-repair endonuclease